MSSIKVKSKHCKECNHFGPLFSKGRCKNCAQKSYKPLGTNKTKSQTQKMQAAAEKQRKRDNAEFLQEMSNDIPVICDNCKQHFGYIVPWKRHWVKAHILPKNKNQFPSVATEPDNILNLCIDDMNNCHRRWDENNAEGRRLMPVYPLAVERIEKFYDKLSDKEQVLLTKYI